MLTELEVSTLHRLANGQLVKQVAHTDSVSHSCVDKRISNIKRKLNAKTLCEAAYKATKAGIICLLITTTSALEIELAINPDFTDADIQRRFSRRINSKSKRETSLQ
ncbi:hypothetical protein ValSw33_66 [Vibrio phage ValSw3-3]|nr:hypothetical protein ValSw33_66 [Vibrio phage ValSw3-3]